jgi:hypothetical protein
MNSDLEMEMRWRTRVSYSAHYVPSLRTLAGSEVHARGIKMTIEGKDSSSIPKGVLNNDDPFVGSPAVRLRIRHLAVPDAVDRFPEAGRAISPVFSSMKSVIAVSEPPKISPS